MSMYEESQAQLERTRAAARRERTEIAFLAVLVIVPILWIIAITQPWSSIYVHDDYFADDFDLEIRSEIQGSLASAVNCSLQWWMDTSEPPSFSPCDEA